MKKIVPLVLLAFFILLGILYFSSTDTSPKKDYEIKEVSFDLHNLPYTNENVSVFRHSLEFNPSTKEGSDAFYNSISKATIIKSDVVQQALLSSANATDVIKYLESHKAELVKLTQKTDALMFTIAGTPKWLTPSGDKKPLGTGSWKKYNTYAPKDNEEWSALVQSIALFFNQQEFMGTDIYYEIWAEPDNGYWSEGQNSYLDFYRQTSLAIRNVSKRANIGGAGLNNWYGTLSNSNTNLNFALIEYARKQNLSLNFISWHYHSLDMHDLEIAKEAYMKEITKQSYNPSPKLIVSSWNAPEEITGTSYQPAFIAQSLVKFHSIGISQEVFSSWQEPLHSGNSTTQQAKGMISSNGSEKPEYYVHQLLSYLSDNKEIYINENSSTYVLSKKPDDCYSLVSWSYVEDPSLASINFLRSKISDSELISDYNLKGNFNGLISFIKVGTSINGKRDYEFYQAAQIYNSLETKSKKEIKQAITMLNSESLAVQSAYSIKADKRVKEIKADHNVIEYTHEPNEIVSIDFCTA